MAGKPFKARGCSLKRKPRLDDYKVFALRDSKPSPLNEPSQRIQTSLCSVNLPLLSSTCSSWSTDSLPLSSDSLFRELLYKSTFLRRCLALPMLGCRPRWNSTHRDWMSPLRWRESLLSALAASFLFREQPRPSQPSRFFPTRDLRGKSSGAEDLSVQRWVSLHRLYLRVPHSLRWVFTRSLHPPGPASLCVFNRSGLIQWKRWRRDGLQPIIGGFRYWGAPDAEEPCERLLTRRIK